MAMTVFLAMAGLVGVSFCADEATKADATVAEVTVPVQEAIEMVVEQAPAIELTGEVVKVDTEDSTSRKVGRNRYGLTTDAVGTSFISLNRVG